MECVTNALIPRRVTTLYSDTKKSYECIVQNNVTDPQLSSLHLKLRIQKDRLVAWGLEWADSNATQSGDIDDSLDRAGISDLVASILTAIRELLDEAERLQPQSRLQLPATFPSDKGGSLSTFNRKWSSLELARLGDIVKDITVSIDTLCDLSRSQQAVRKPSSDHDGPFTEGKTQAFHDTKTAQRAHPVADGASALPHVSSLVSSMWIDQERLLFPMMSDAPTNLPPSYDTVTKTPSNRAFAFLTTVAGIVPVLVDYCCEEDSSLAQGGLPFHERYEGLVLALQSSVHENENAHVYTGSFKILGWISDGPNSRFGFIYELPQTSLYKDVSSAASSQPQTLLALLQHGAYSETRNMPYLEDRFRLAFNLATNLLHIHAKNLTHRNLNSSNIIFTNDGKVETKDSQPWERCIIRKPYLTSWDQCNEDTPTPRHELLTSSIYRHPLDNRGQRSAYRPSFDLYSLGLVLFEVGLWVPIQKLWKTKYTRSDFKVRLLSTYAKRLAEKCGSNYLCAVEYCLRAADGDSTSQASQSPVQNESQCKLQTDFYWNALKRLERCCAIDDSNEPVPWHSSSGSATHNQATTRPRVARIPAVVPLVENSPQASAMPEVLRDTPKAMKRFAADSPSKPGVLSDLFLWSWDVPQPTRHYFDTFMMPKLNRMYSKAINRMESMEIFIFMGGDTPETARPTMFIICLSTLRAFRIAEYINADKKLFDIKVGRGQLHYSKKTKNKKSRRPRNICLPTNNAIERADSHILPKADQVPTSYQERPMCGASIGAFVDENNLESVTFGGIVLIDGQPFGMSVHHMLQDQDLDHPPMTVLDDHGSTPGHGLETKSSEAIDCWDPLPQSHENQGCRPPQKSYDDGSLPELEDDIDVSIFDQDEDDSEDLITLGDSTGTKPGQGRDIIITQPALDDLDEALFSSQDNICDEHLSSHGLGYIHASSGLKRVKHGENHYEVDWALIKICERRLNRTNLVQGAERYCPKAQAQDYTYPHQIMKADAIGGLDVHAFGNISGLAAGTILPYMQMTRAPGRGFYEPAWRFEGDFGGS